MYEGGIPANDALFIKPSSIYFFLFICREGAFSFATTILPPCAAIS